MRNRLCYGKKIQRKKKEKVIESLIKSNVGCILRLLLLSANVRVIKVDENSNTLINSIDEGFLK